MHDVVETAAYIAAAERAGLTDADMQEIVWAVANDPTMGDLIKGTGGARKIRWALQGGGKRGGVRLITLFVVATGPVFLVGCYAKSRQGNLSGDEITDLKTMSEAIKKGASK